MKRKVIKRSDVIYESDKFEEINISDGSWVLEAVEGNSGWVDGRIRRCELLGVNANSIIRHTTSYTIRVSHSEGYDARQTTLFIAPDPFGAIIWSARSDKSMPRQRFEPAREVHHGELGRNPPVEMPKFFHEGAGTSDPRIWANLAETARLADMDPLELLQRYYPFDNFDSCSWLWLSIGELPDKTFKLKWKSPSEFPRVIAPPGLAAYATDDVDVPHADARRLWVTGEFARSALYLRHFGYVPSLS